MARAVGATEWQKHFIHQCHYWHYCKTRGFYVEVNHHVEPPLQLLQWRMGASAHQKRRWDGFHLFMPTASHADHTVCWISVSMHIYIMHDVSAGLLQLARPTVPVLFTLLCVIFCDRRLSAMLSHILVTVVCVPLLRVLHVHAYPAMSSLV